MSLPRQTSIVLAMARAIDSEELNVCCEEICEEFKQFDLQKCQATPLTGDAMPYVFEMTQSRGCFNGIKLHHANHCDMEPLPFPNICIQSGDIRFYIGVEMVLRGQNCRVVFSRDQETDGECLLVFVEGHPRIDCELNDRSRGLFHQLIRMIAPSVFSNHGIPYQSSDLAYLVCSHYDYFDINQDPTPFLAEKSIFAVKPCSEGDLCDIVEYLTTFQKGANIDELADLMSGMDVDEDSMMEDQKPDHVVSDYRHRRYEAIVRGHAEMEISNLNPQILARFDSIASAVLTWMIEYGNRRDLYFPPNNFVEKYI